MGPWYPLPGLKPGLVTLQSRLPSVDPLPQSSCGLLNSLEQRGLLEDPFILDAYPTLILLIQDGHLADSLSLLGFCLGSVVLAMSVIVAHLPEIQPLLEHFLNQTSHP